MSDFVECLFDISAVLGGALSEVIMSGLRPAFCLMGTNSSLVLAVKFISNDHEGEALIAASML